MARSNLTRHFHDRFNRAADRLDSENETVLRGALNELIDLLLDPQLPRFLRLRANFALADLEEDWFLAEDYRKEAERTLAEIRRLLPPGTAGKVMEKKLDDVRDGLQQLAKEQLEDDPRQDWPVEKTESRPASEPERSASLDRMVSQERGNGNSHAATSSEPAAPEVEIDAREERHDTRRC